MTAPCIELVDVTIAYGNVTVVSKVSLSVARGETLVVVGASGSGKSSLLRAILGLLTPSRGAIRIDGEIVSQDRRMFRQPGSQTLAMVFQNLALWPHMTVRGNLAFALEAREVRSHEREQAIKGTLDELELHGREQRYPGELSGGERQRVALARALVTKPSALLLDEPLTNLDVLLKRDLIGLLQRVLKKRATTGLYVTHDPEEARTLGDRIAALSDGAIVQTGTWDELSSAPANDFVRALTGGRR